MLANKIYESKDMAEFQTTFDTGLSYYSIGNNDLLVSWYPEPSYDCDLNATRSLSCRMELGTYHLELEFTDGVTSINTTVDNNRDVWTDDHPIMAQFYTAFYPQAGATFPEGLDPNTEFGKAQALAIRQALTMALGGFATLCKYLHVESSRCEA